jgi:hypothetical protein
MLAIKGFYSDFSMNVSDRRFYSKFPYIVEHRSFLIGLMFLINLDCSFSISALVQTDIDFTSDKPIRILSKRDSSGVATTSTRSISNLGFALSLSSGGFPRLELSDACKLEGDGNLPVCL